LTKETKQEHDFAGLIWFTRKQNQYPDVPGSVEFIDEVHSKRNKMNYLKRNTL